MAITRVFASSSAFVFVLAVTAVASSSELLIERSLTGHGRSEDTSACSDQLSAFTCQEIVDQERCSRDNAMARACRRSCGFCNDDEDSRVASSRGPQCEDMFPSCSEFGGVSNQQFCCMFISFMNQTCPKSCMFCTEISTIPSSPIQGVPLPGTGSVGGSGPQAPTVVTQQNPCKADPNKPPTVGINPSPGRRRR